MANVLPAASDNAFLDSEYSPRILTSTIMSQFGKATSNYIYTVLLELILASALTRNIVIYLIIIMSFSVNEKI